MGLETVKEEIVRTAKEQETALVAEARKEADRLVKEAEEKVEELKEKNNAVIKAKVDVLKKQELASAELENKKMFLEAKKHIIESVFVEAKKQLEGLNAQKREAYIRKLLEKVKNDIDAATIYCNKKDLKLLKGFKAEPTGIIGGLIAENKDETIRVDYSFETILQGIEDNELQTINKLLFG